MNQAELEPDETAKVKAKQLYGLTLQDPETLFKTSAETFDAITMWHVLEHVHDLHKDLDQVKKLLKPKGFLFIAVPNYTCYDQKIYQEYWAAYDVLRHLYHFSPTAMKRLLQLHGLKIKSLEPMWFDSFYVSMLSEKYRSGSNNIVKALWNGFISNCKAITNTEKCSSIIYVIQK
ncbi:MAG: class I SAM-dependent methyltransferase [Chitinophagaceae bacterium]|nr:class I SAM-dependent methyltransferase [Chitinophagaceae bacterium]